MKWADYLELMALEAADGSATLSDLESQLRLISVRSTERVLADVTWEIDDRARAAASGYPFTFDNGNALVRRGAVAEYVPYVFCLGLSYNKWQPTSGAVNPWLLFERVSAIALRRYLGAPVHIFGTSRKSNKGFGGKVDRLCEFIGEGGGFRPQPEHQSKDRRVDLVCVRHFPDRRSSKLAVFAQCAAGGNWRSKLFNSFDGFCGQWMQIQPTSTVLPMIFIPHRVTASRWDIEVRSAGVVFDRCRIAAHAAPDARDGEVWDLARYWCEHTMNEVRWEDAA